jgi:hypothetical protein
MIASQTISTGARPFAGTRVASKFARNGSRVCMKAGNWLPGSDTPAYLENLPASYGFGELLTSRKEREWGGRGGWLGLKASVRVPTRGVESFSACARMLLRVHRPYARGRLILCLMR